MNGRERVDEASHLPGRITLTMALTLLIGTSALILPSAALRPHGTHMWSQPTPMRSMMPTMQFGQLPPEVSIVLKPSYAGASRGGKPMDVGTEAELRALWNAMVKVYGNRDDALAAVRKEQQVILPYMNKPTTIIGAHGVLVDFFGKEGAAELIRKHPGVLACNPKSLAETSPEEIQKTADFVVWFDALPQGVKEGVPFVSFFVIAGAIAFRVAACSDGSCAANQWDLKGGLGVQLVDFVRSALTM